MALFGKSSDQYIKDANQSSQNAFNTAAGYENPYTSHADEDFEKARQGIFKALGGRKDYGSQFYDYLNMSPTELLSQVMRSYTQSPFNQEKQQYATSAENNMLNSTGQAGSANEQLMDSLISSTIQGEGQQQYLKDVQGTFGEEDKLLQQYNQGT